MKVRNRSVTVSVTVAMTRGGGIDLPTRNGDQRENEQRTQPDRYCEERVPETGDQPGTSGEITGDRGQRRDTESSADLVAGHHDSGGNARLLGPHPAHRRDRD